MTFHIFAGQGVRHSKSGAFGVVHQTNDSERRNIQVYNEGKEPEYQKKVPRRLALVQFTGGSFVVPVEELGPASMDSAEFEELQAKIETYSEQRNSRTLIPVNSLESLNLHADYRVFTDKVIAVVNPRQPIAVETTMDNGLVVTGGKCEHGVYITHERYEDTSKYCSLCHPYIIMAKSGIEFKA